MKKVFTLLVLLFAFQSSYSQTKILDSSVSWNAPKTVTVYLSDSLATAVTLKLSSEFGGSDVLNVSYTVGSTISISDNMLVIPISNINPGAYFADVLVSTPGGLLQMQFKTAN